MLLIAFFFGLAGVESEPIGAFHHGPWEGACFRDGFLAGRDDEVCRATWSGRVYVMFNRDADGLTLYISATSSTGRQCAKPLSFSPGVLAQRGRTTRVALALDAGLRAVAKQCAVRTRSPTTSVSDLQAMLRETDGLIHLDSDVLP